MKNRQGKEVVGKVLDDLVRYTKFHFAREEEFFAKTGYPAVEHKKEHAELVKQAEALQSRYKSGEVALSIEALDFLKDWLTIHIQGTDKKYSSNLNANGIVTSSSSAGTSIRRCIPSFASVRTQWD